MGLAAGLLVGESTTIRMVAGGALVLCAMLLVEAGPRRKIEGEVHRKGTAWSS